MKCENCGATIDPGALACPFCQSPTPAAAFARQRREQEAQAQLRAAATAQEQAAAAARARLEATAGQALGWSIAGLVICCLPLAVIGVVQGLRARSMAAAARVPLPGKATVGLALGLLATLSSISAVTWAIRDGNRQEEYAAARLAVLRQKIDAHAGAPVLDHDTACALAEAHAIESGHDGHLGRTLEHFECVGKLAVDHDRAELSDLRFRWSSTTYDTSACFKYGARWYVGELRSGPCPAR
jgi:hypothetical protein